MKVQAVPEQRQAVQPIHHPACPARLALGPCGCPAEAAPIEQEHCPACGAGVRLWHAHTAEGWAEWLVCAAGCSFREAL